MAQAGVPGAVTIATNMAGRGTDIQLGGNADMRIRRELVDVPEGPEREAKIAAIRAEVAELKKKALAAGGLYVVGTERHESRRIDNQLRGRSGRQGDPGRSKFYLSLQDDLMRIFGSERMDGMLQKLGLKEDEAIIHPWINKAIEKAQQKVEARNFDMRKNILKYDDVMNDQRKVVFEQRREFMAEESVRATIDDMRHGVVEDVVTRAIPAGAYPEQWDLVRLDEEVRRMLALELPVADWAKEEGIADEEIRERIKAAADEAYAARIEKNTPEVMTYVEKQVLLQMLDHLWREHLVTLDHLRQVIGWRGMAQRDPLNEYKQEAFELFDGLITHLREQVTGQLMRVEVMFQQPAEPQMPPMQAHHIDATTGLDEFAGLDASSRAAMALGFSPGAEAAPAVERDPQRSVDLGPRRPQRSLPLRLGQEVQALPRAVRLTAQTAAVPPHAERVWSRRRHQREKARFRGPFSCPGVRRRCSPDGTAASAGKLLRRRHRDLVGRRAGYLPARRQGNGRGSRGRRTRRSSGRLGRSEAQPALVERLLGGAAAGLLRRDGGRRRGGIHRRGRRAPPGEDRTDRRQGAAGRRRRRDRHSRLGRHGRGHRGRRRSGGRGRGSGRRRSCNISGGRDRRPRVLALAALVDVIFVDHGHSFWPADLAQLARLLPREHGRGAIRAGIGHRGLAERRMLAAVSILDARRGSAAVDEFGHLLLVGAGLGGDGRGDRLVDIELGTGGRGIQPPARRRGVEHVALAAVVDLRLLLRHLEVVGAFLQVLPERDIRVVPEAGEVLGRHAERIGLELHVALAAVEGLAHHRVDFLDLVVGHGEAAARRAGAVHHDVAAAAAHGALHRVRIPDVERQPVGGVGVHLRGGHRVEALGDLAVALLLLRPELARPPAHRIRLQVHVLALGVQLPDLDLGFFLVGADQNRRAARRVLLRHQVERIARDRRVGPRREAA